jgi:hypothetical protein
MIKTYGKSIGHFATPYTEYVEKNLDKVSNILWEKEPIPLTILNYFEELNSKIQVKAETRSSESDSNLDAVLEAKQLFGRT